MKKIIPAILLVACLGGALAAETMELTLQQAVELGLANSTGIRIKMLALASARADLGAARSAYTPAVSASIGYAHLDEPSMFSGQDPAGLDLDVMQSVATFGKTAAGIRLAEAGLAQAELDLAEEQRSLTVLIENAFYSYLLALEVDAINRETLANKEDALEVARQRYAAGLISDFEVLTSESDLESFKSTVISSANGIEVALLNVRNMLNIPADAELDIVLIGELAPLAVKLDKSELIERALKNRYDVRSFRTLLRLAEVQEDLSRSLRRPVLGAFFNYSLDSGVDLATGESLYGAGDWQKSWSAGLSLSVPVSGWFPWSRESLEVKSAELGLERQRLDYSALESGLRIAVETLLLKIAEEEAKIASGAKSVELAERLYNSATQQYEAGLISSIDLKDAQLGLNGARLAYTRAVYGYNMNILDLKNTVGVTDF
jgi:outer membrane protein